MKILLAEAATAGLPITVLTTVCGLPGAACAE
jgi:hypothetical protein